jgi:hypothetical protein
LTCPQYFTLVLARPWWHWRGALDASSAC